MNDTREPKKLFPIMSLAEMMKLPKLKWLVRGLIPAKSLTVMYGAPGSCKTFVALGMALSLAYGINWRGKTLPPTAVAYIAGEGGMGMKNRLDAWHRHHDLATYTNNFVCIPVAVNLLDISGDVAGIIEQLQQLETKLDIKFGLVVVDTLARSMVGGNENSAEYMSVAIASADIIKEKLCAAVLLVHHTGKDEDRGARGSSALKGAADAELKVSSNKEANTVDLRVCKMKDAEDNFNITFSKHLVALDYDDENELESSLVVEPMEEIGGRKISKAEADAITIATQMETGKHYSIKALSDLLRGRGIKLFSPCGDGYKKLRKTIVTDFGREVETPLGKRKIKPSNGGYICDDLG